MDEGLMSTKQEIALDIVTNARSVNGNPLEFLCLRPEVWQNVQACAAGEPCDITTDFLMAVAYDARCLMQKEVKRYGTMFVPTIEYLDKILYEWVEADPRRIVKQGGLDTYLHRGNESENWHCFKAGDYIYPYKLDLSEDMSPFGWDVITSPPGIATLAMWAKRNALTYLGRRTLTTSNRLFSGGYYVTHHSVKVEPDPALPKIVGGYYEQYEMTLGTVRVDRRYLIGV